MLLVMNVSAMVARFRRHMGKFRASRFKVRKVGYNIGKEGVIESKRVTLGEIVFL